MTPREAGYKGGSATLDRYGAGHMARITQGRKRLPRFSEGKRLGRHSEGAGTQFKEGVSYGVPLY